MRAYYVEYVMNFDTAVRGIQIPAKTRDDAHLIAADKIKEIEGDRAEMIYVASVTYNNGKCKRFEEFRWDLLGCYKEQRS